MRDTQWDKDLFAGLKALAESAFPKVCPNCGKRFGTAEQFLRETQGLPSHGSGLKAVMDDDHTAIVEVYRNCVCGSTLMDFFGDRRDSSPAGRRRRQRFGEVLEMLVKAGLERELARRELLQVVRGGESEIIRRLRNRGSMAPPPPRRREAEGGGTGRLAYTEGA